MSMNNVNVTLDTIGAISRISSTNVDMKESVFNFIKNDILSHEIKNLIYLAIPMWSYCKGTWNEDIPKFYANKKYYELYKQFFACLNELEFSFVDFVSTKLKTIPLYVDIEYVDGPLSEYCNSVDSDRIHIFFSKDSIINYRVEDILSIRESDADFKKFAAQILSHIVNYDVNVALKLYKFLGVYTIYFADLKYITIINSILYKPTNTSKDVGYGGAIVVLKKELSEMAKRLISIVLNIKHKEIAVSDWIEKNTIDLQRESLKSAVSAIMTRNMSHNLGSHYLHYTKAQLEQLAKRGGEFGPDIRGAAKVMEYMQGRMDYLATLVSGDRFPYGCVNFKSQIYDVLTIDDFSKRHFKNCKRVSNEQLSPIMEIVAEIQKNNNNKKNVREKIPDLYSKSRDALQNDGYSRTTNFLLSNLILSEGFTRSHILNDNENIENSINLHVLFDNQIFTGAPIVFDDTILNEIIKKEEENGLSQEEAERKKELETQKSDKEKQRIAEEKAKQAISNINIAMPGGVMSCHAFFNIIENFIRNSAKYLQSDFSENKDLTITIKIAEKLVDHKQDKENSDDANGEKVDVYEFTIFDNKHNANKKQPDTNKSLLDDLVDKISNLRILDDNNVLDKKDKGFKEMLFSALWLRSYVYQNADGKNNPNSYEDVLVQIQSIKEPSVKLKQIKKYGFSFLAVDNDGQENDTEKANLALRFTLPKFNKTTKLELANDENIDLGNLLHIYADIASVDDGFTDFVKQLNKERADKEKDSYGEDMIIPRMLRKADSKITDVKALQTVLYTRFGEEFDNYKISSDDNNTSELEKQYNIYFKRHLSTQCKTMENYKNYAYADSVSGGNYTITLFDTYNRWVKNGRDTASEDYYEILKIKESALTRITLIDERLYKKMKVQKTETELACKNIRILNYNESNFSEDKIDNFINLFMDDHKFNNGNNSTHFLSIHLGIIEKIVKNADMFTLMRNENGQPVSIDDKVKIFMRLLKEKFGSKVFVSVHSGRGNFSAELEQSLDMYPFISMAALENAFENSKYLLCQLFYSTIYIGKGVANQHNQED